MVNRPTRLLRFVAFVHSPFCCFTRVYKRHFMFCYKEDFRLSLAVRLCLHKFLDVIQVCMISAVICLSLITTQVPICSVFIHCLGSSLLPITKNTGTTRTTELQNYREELKGLQELQNYRTTELKQLKNYRTTCLRQLHNYKTTVLHKLQELQELQKQYKTREIQKYRTTLTTTPTARTTAQHELQPLEELIELQNCKNYTLTDLQNYRTT